MEHDSSLSTALQALGIVALVVVFYQTIALVIIVKLYRKLVYKNTAKLDSLNARISELVEMLKDKGIMK